MGCVSSNSPAAERKARGSRDVSILKTSAANANLNDCEVAQKKAEANDPKVLNKKVEQIIKKNKELNTQVIVLKREMEIKKKESQETIEEKETQMRKIEQEKNKQIETLKKQLQKQRQKQKQAKDHKGRDGQDTGQKQIVLVGLKSMQKHKGLCEQCFYKLPRFTDVNPKMTECFNCRGYGLVFQRFPYGANPSCEKSLCFTKGWDKVKCLKVCSLCGGKGGQQTHHYNPRRF